jgi:amidase
MAKFFTKYDMLLTPMGREPSMPLRYFKNNPPNFMIEALRNKDYSSYALYEPFANMTGQPAASIPLFWSKNNMPIGSQFFARFGKDATLLQLAAQLEEANPWFNKLPEMTKAL